jgi:putative transposase
MNEFYHTYNRGTEKREIFLERIDYLRAVHDLYEFNDVNAVVNLKQRFNGGSTSIIAKPRERLIDIIAWCLMPNHYHLFSCPKVENGLSKFHQKFGGGFTGYFNLKYQRSGVLFQGKYKKIQVTTDKQVGHLICYIHSNPLDIWKPNWKEKRLTDLELQNALKFLESEYRWSSHLDYLGIKNFPSLIDTNFVFNFFNGPKGYREFFSNWLRYYEKNIKFVQKFTLD